MTAPPRTSPRMCRGADDLAVDLEQRRHARLEALVGREHRGVALRLVAEAEVLPHAHVRGAELADQHVVDELLRRARGEPLVERDHHELLHADALDQLGLAVEGRQQRRRGVRRDDGRRVRVEGQHGVGAADHLAVAQVHAVERADGDAPRARLRVGEPGDLHPAEPYGRLDAAALARLGDADRALLVFEDDRARRASMSTERAVARAPRLLALEGDDGQERAKHVASAISVSPSAASTPHGPMLVRRSDSQ